MDLLSWNNIRYALNRNKIKRGRYIVHKSEIIIVYVTCDVNTPYFIHVFEHLLQRSQSPQLPIVFLGSRAFTGGIFYAPLVLHRCGYAIPTRRRYDY